MWKETKRSRSMAERRRESLLMSVCDPSGCPVEGIGVLITGSPDSRCSLGLCCSPYLHCIVRTRRQVQEQGGNMVDELKKSSLTFNKTHICA